MKSFVSIVLVLAAVISLAGCGRKEPALEESQEPMSMEAMSALDTETQRLAEADKAKAPAEPVTQPKLEPPLPQGPYQPAVREIQTALKNAGLYTGPIDGKKGPLTNSAIKEFQKANGLDIDGKVGLKTWDKLKKYLDSAPQPEAKKK